jgi:hypothetical protein
MFHSARAALGQEKTEMAVALGRAKAAAGVPKPIAGRGDAHAGDRRETQEGGRDERSTGSGRYTKGRVRPHIGR